MWWNTKSGQRTHRVVDLSYVSVRKSLVLMFMSVVPVDCDIVNSNSFCIFSEKQSAGLCVCVCMCISCHVLPYLCVNMYACQRTRCVLVLGRMWCLVDDFPPPQVNVYLSENPRPQAMGQGPLVSVSLAHMLNPGSQMSDDASAGFWNRFQPA